MSALQEKRNPTSSQVGTEHLLLALTRVTDSTALRVLEQMGISPDEVRAKVISLTELPE